MYKHSNYFIFRSAVCTFPTAEHTFPTAERTFPIAEYKPIAMFIHIYNKHCYYIIIVINKRFKYRKMTVFESLSKN